MSLVRLKTPLLVDSSLNEIVPLKRAPFQAKDETEYDEAWLQSILASQPSVLPISGIEPAFTPALFACKELPIGRMALDILFVTPRGNLIAVECKLWRNPEARRKVIAQAIDYAAGLQAITYDQLQKAIRGARKDDSFNLYKHVTSEANDSLDESEFVDAVSRNLRNGRCLLLIVGDGYREETEAMTEFLQRHAGAHFALALVDVSVYIVPSTGQRLLIRPCLSKQ